ncbi:MAG: ROK family protein [Oscillospiraceae bacterium]|nr:ROK family protein [Oscillospiraceae bacterium]
MQPNNHFQRHRLILNMINHLGPVSRTSLIELTGYRPATVGSIVGELLEKELIVETGFRSSGQGRKRTMLEIHKSHICGIGISFTAHRVCLVLSQFDGTILQQQELPYGAEHPDALTEQITAGLQTLLQQYQDRFFAGIGICKPLVDPLRYRSMGSVYTGPRSTWFEKTLAPYLEQTFHLRTEIFSSVTLPAQAEHRFGAARDVEDFIWVELSNGVGTSIFSGGHAIGGADGTAGELGHTVTEGGAGRMCYCGKPDCVETAAAWPALQQQLRGALESGVISCLQQRADKPLTVQDVRWALDQNDRMCRHYVAQAAGHLGRAIANAINLLNPRLIVLYGFMLELGPCFLEELERSMRSNTVFTSENFEVRISDTSEQIMPLGAIANILSSYLRTEDYRWVYSLDKTDR